MDPVTTAIVAAVSVGVVSGVTESGKKFIADSYEALKSKLKRKFGEDSKINKAVLELEEEPDSEGRKLTLQEKIAAVNADKDSEISKAAQDLLDKIKALPKGRQHIAIAMGERSVALTGNISGTVNTGDQIKEKD